MGLLYQGPETHGHKLLKLQLQSAGNPGQQLCAQWRATWTLQGTLYLCGISVLWCFQDENRQSYTCPVLVLAMLQPPACAGLDSPEIPSHQHCHGFVAVTTCPSCCPGSDTKGALDVTICPGCILWQQDELTLCLCAWLCVSRDCVTTGRGRYGCHIFGEMWGWACLWGYGDMPWGYVNQLDFIVCLCDGDMLNIWISMYFWLALCLWLSDTIQSKGNFDF